MRTRSRRTAVGAAAVAGITLAMTGTVLASSGGSGNAWPYAPTPKAPVLAAVGDISCEPDGDVTPEPAASYLCNDTRNNAQVQTARQIEGMKPDLVALLGDEQYQVGRLNDFKASFDTTYGAFKFLQRPAPGNHEFYAYKDGEAAQNGAGYFGYYNGVQTDAKASPLRDGAGNPLPQPAGQAAQTGDGWYSYDLGSWHLVSLNAECANQPGGCSPNGAWFARQTQWLQQDLASSRAACTLAYWHQPTFSASGEPSTEGALADTWWKVLYQHHADVVLNGHEHLYARSAPTDPAGKPDPKRGIRQIIIGTGGEGLDTLASPRPATIQAANDTSYGVMKLTLDKRSYTASYQATNGTGYSDTSSGTCHGADD